MSRQLNDDWWQHSMVRALAKAGAWGLGAMIIFGLVVPELLDVVDARNPRILTLVFWIARIGAFAWAVSWGVIIVVGMIRWLLVATGFSVVKREKPSKDGDARGTSD